MIKARCIAGSAGPNLDQHSNSEPPTGWRYLRLDAMYSQNCYQENRLSSILHISISHGLSCVRKTNGPGAYNFMRMIQDALPGQLDQTSFAATAVVPNHQLTLSMA
jgi:hypothetical protein